MFKANVELPDQGDNIIRTRDLEANPNPNGFGCELFMSMRKYADNIAQIDAETGKSETYRSLLQKCVRVALHLQKRGVSSKDIVSPCISDHADSAVAILAPLFLGAKIAGVDPYRNLDDFKAMINVVKPKLLFVNADVVENIEKVVEELNLTAEIVVFGPTTRHIPFDDFLLPLPGDEKENFAPFEVNDLFETSTIIFSSGSTGVPKGICINHYAILCQLSRYVNPGAHKATSIAYTTFGGISGHMSIGVNTLNGSPRLICSKLTPEKIWKYLVKYNATTLSLSPFHAMLFINYGNPDKLETPNLKFIMISGGQIPPNKMIALKSIFSHPVIVIASFGQSEVYGAVLAMDNMRAFADKPESAGKPTTGFWYKVVDVESGRTLGSNEMGEICVKSKFCMSGFYERDSSDRFDSDGFLKTGDMGYYDCEHYFYIKERISEAWKNANNWVFPTELEAILYEHPAVKVACAMRITIDNQKVPIGLVVKVDSAGDVTEEELLNFVHDRVEDYKKLHRIVFIDEDAIPTTPNGKIRRYLLRKDVLQRLEHTNAA